MSIEGGASNLRAPAERNVHRIPALADYADKCSIYIDV